MSKRMCSYLHTNGRGLRIISWILTFLCIFSFGLDSVFISTEAAYMQNDSAPKVYGTVNGLSKADQSKAIVLLYDTVNSYSTAVSTSGEFFFEGIPDGEYFLKIEVEGYHIPASQKIKVDSGSSVKQDIEVTSVDESGFYYQWKADDTYFGYEESANIPEKKTIVFLDETIYVNNSNAVEKLYKNYQFILSDEDLPWSNDYASRMLDLVESIYGDNRPYTTSKWILTADEIDDDVKISHGAEYDTVRICQKAFEKAIPRKAEFNGLKGSYFSNRLYHALVRYATDAGNDIAFVDSILRRDYGCSIMIEDYETLTKDTTRETAAAFEQFKPEELMAILEMFAEMPEGFHRIEHLEYLVRRIDGGRNPIYSAAAAVSWVYAEHGYIEFMDSAFLGSEVEDTFRLVLHEKSHFLWKNVFSDALKDEWIKIGGWYQTDKDSDEWATTKETEFVTAYAHAHNPDEDMAESIAYYILMPDRLESRSPAKYQFIRDYIMNGEIYIAQIREDLTFEVYNLYPDYNYPGRIVGVDVRLDGQPEEDKQLIVTVTLDTGGDAIFGAREGIMRLTSDVDTFYDLRVYPVNDDCSVLQGTITISKYAYCGYWHNEQIVLTDQAGNQRFSGVDRFGWKLYVDNPLSDTEKPAYIKDSLHVEKEVGTLDGHPITYVHVKFKATDNIGVSSVYCEMANNTHDSYRLDKWGTYDSETQEADITFIFTEYMQSGEYSVNYIAIKDLAENFFEFNLYEDGSGVEVPATFTFESENSDYEPPELDVNNISLYAYPTHPENPNGETVVTINYLARDNASGLGLVSYRLLDPLGKTYFEYHYHDNFYTTFFDGDPTAWKMYEITVVLPEGSAPGTWGLLELYLSDKAGNFKTYNFLEIVHFKIDTDSNEPTYTLSSKSKEIAIGEQLQINIDDKDADKEYYTYCTNKTGRAVIDQNGVLRAIKPGDVTVYAFEKDDNTKYGKIDVTIVDKYTVSAPKAPTIYSKTDTTVTLNPTNGYEYKMDDGQWQTNNVFTGLVPHSTHNFYQRVAETATAKASASSSALSVTTDKSTVAAPAQPKVESKTQTSVTLQTVPGCEYSRDGEQWQNSPTFDGLQPDREYTFYQRYKETETAKASEKSTALTVRTDPEYIPGDVNSDGKIDTRDIILLRKYMASQDPVTGISPVEISPGADANGDGAVDTRDIILLRRYMASQDPVTGESTVVLGPAA